MHLPAVLQFRRWCNTLPFVSQTLSIRLPDTLREKLEADAQSTGQSKSQIVLGELERRYAGRGDGQGIMRLAGIMRGPADLSTNKAYRRAWGKRAK